MEGSSACQLEYLPIPSPCSHAAYPSISWRGDTSTLIQPFFAFFFVLFFFLLYSCKVGICGKMYPVNLFLSLVFVFGPLALCWVPSSPAHKHGGEQYQANDKQGAVASESAVCSHIGIDLIKGGGNAADAVCPE